MSQAVGEVFTMQSGRKRVSVDEHSMNDISFSRDTTRQKINDKRSVDTIFECQYGKQVFESRLALMSRWTWFKDVLSTGNADVTWVAPLLKVRLPEIASCTLQFVLDFLYTGKVPQLNVVQAVDVIRACKSKYFHGELPKLEETAMNFLEWKLSITYDDSFRAALELSLVEFRTLAGASSASRIEILSQTTLGPVHFRQLSENALRLYLDNTIIEPAELDGMWAYQRSLSASYRGHCLKITPRTARTNQLGNCHKLWANFEKNFQRLDARVKFRLDLNKHVCSIAVNDDNYLPAWDALPSDHDAVFFPAVCLGMEAGGQIRIRLIRGFGMV